MASSPEERPEGETLQQESVVSSAGPRRKAAPRSAQQNRPQTETSAPPPEGSASATDPSTPTTSGPPAAAVPAAQDDNPATVDLLDRDALVRCLAAMIKSNDQRTPLTIALFGDWGAGKTTVMELLKARLTPKDKSRTRKVLFADFNVWSYEHCDNLAAALAHEVKAGLTAKLPLSQRMRLIYGYSVRRNGWALLRTLIAAITLVLGVVGVVAFNADALAGRLVAAGFGTVAAGALAVFLSQVVSVSRVLFNHPLVNSVSGYLALPEFSKHLGIVAGLRQDIQELCEAGLGKNDGKDQPRLVLFVDDMDRCRPGAIVRALEAVRLVMDVKGVVTIIAVDHRVALRAIGDHYSLLADQERTKEEIARDYLGKIVQLPIRLHDPAKSNVSRFVREGLFGFDKQPDIAPVQAAAPPEEDSLMEDSPAEADDFVKLADKFHIGNPRQLRRLRNSYRLLKALRPASSSNSALLQMLFFQERIRSLPPDLFDATESAILHRKPLPKEVPADLSAALHDFAPDQYAALARVVTQVVMPRSRRGPAEQPGAGRAPAPPAAQPAMLA